MVSAMFPNRRDRGAVLVLTLIFTVVLALVVIALANYATTGLKTSETPTMRTDTNFDAASAVNWAVEEFAAKRLAVDPDPLVSDCGYAPTPETIPLPAGLVPNGYTAELTCAETTPIAGEPVVHLHSVVTTPTGSVRFVEATIEVPRYVHGARVSDWRVDIPIDVPPYVATTTTSTSSTTSTTAPVNQSPVANTTSITVNADMTYPFFLNASDPDPGDTLNAVIDLATVPGWTVVATSGTYVELNIPSGTADGVYPLPYTVTDSGSLSASSALEVTVVSSPIVSTTTTSSTTTTTTLAPNAACRFELTSVSTNQKEGAGTLTISNIGGGAFSGWAVHVSPSGWSFSWSGAIGVSGGWDISSGSTTASIPAGSTGTPVASALVTNGPTSGSKLSVGQTFPCSVTSP